MPVKRIFSAGGIVLRQAQDESSFGKNGLEVLVTQHSKHKGWDFPKGHREVYESEEQTALREVEEETGVVGEIIEKVGQTEYFYWDAGPHSATPGVASKGKEKVLKTVVYFLMKYVGEGEATTAFEVSDMVWLPVGEVEEKLTFKDTKRLWNEVKERISKLKIES